MIRADVAANPSTSPKTLASLVGDSIYVRTELAKNPNAPPKVLTALAKDLDEYIRKNVAENPNTPSEVLTVLAKDFDKNVRYAAKKALNDLKANQLVESIVMYKVWKKLLRVI